MCEARIRDIAYKQGDRWFIILRPVLDFDYALAFSWSLNGAPGHEPKAKILDAGLVR